MRVILRRCLASLMLLACLPALAQAPDGTPIVSARLQADEGMHLDGTLAHPA